MEKQWFNPKNKLPKESCDVFVYKKSFDRVGSTYFEIDEAFYNSVNKQFYTQYGMLNITKCVIKWTIEYVPEFMPDIDTEPAFGGREHMAERILDKIKEDAKNPKIEQRLFTMKSIGKYITLFQDFNRIEVSFSVSNSNDEEQNIIIHLCLLFWAIEVAFEWRPFKNI